MQQQSRTLLLLLLLLQEQPDRAHKATPPTGVLQDPKGAKLEKQQATGAMRYRGKEENKRQPGQQNQLEHRKGKINYPPPHPTPATGQPHHPQGPCQQPHTPLMDAFIRPFMNSQHQAEEKRGRRMTRADHYRTCYSSDVGWHSSALMGRRPWQNMTVELLLGAPAGAVAPQLA
jgi:hypothetical protein